MGRGCSKSSMGYLQQGFVVEIGSGVLMVFPGSFLHCLSVRPASDAQTEHSQHRWAQRTLPEFLLMSMQDPSDRTEWALLAKS